MTHWLANKRHGQEASYLKRFDPRFWTVDFPRPAMASVIAYGPADMLVTAELHHRGELIGLIWESEDRWDHPLLAYETNRDYANTHLSFRWRSSGLATLDQVNGPTLTIEGRDASGAERTWYVRLWNYASGTNTDAVVTLPFSQLEGGWALPGDPVHPGDIDRMFVSIVAPEYAEGSTEPLSERLSGTIRITEIECQGRHAMLELGDVLVPPHGERVATAYDDLYNQTPSRLVRSIIGLGYRDEILHYVGMSHFPRLAYTDTNELTVEPTGELCPPAVNWHRSLFLQAIEAQLEVIASISYELFDEYCPAEWKQMAANGEVALTGWEPPSTLLSPANSEAMAWLQSCALAFAGWLHSHGLPVRIQIGEPWWWVTSDGAICCYDEASIAALGGAPEAITDMKAALTQAQLEVLDQAGSLLGQSTDAVTQAIKASFGDDSEVLLLAFTPTILHPDMPELHRANLPQQWAYPAFDRLQLEDYDWLTEGAEGLRRAAYALFGERLGYPVEQQDYLSGFVLSADDRELLWPRIDRGLDEARIRGIERRFVWALPQIARDGYTRIPPIEEDLMEAFDDVLYPFPLGQTVAVAPEFSTSVLLTASGHEIRNSRWSDARMHFDVGPGIRSESELAELIAFFRARRGAARGFRLSDPFDCSSSGMTGTPTPSDQLIGTGDGLTTDFILTKSYGDGDEPQIRTITRPRPDSVRVSRNGIETSDWSLLDFGIVRFDTAPSAGDSIRAGFLFDIPVRFSEDRIDVSGTNFAAGEAPSIPLIEIREETP